MAEAKVVDPGLADADVVTKYKLAAEMANRTCWTAGLVCIA